MVVAKFWEAVFKRIILKKICQPRGRFFDSRRFGTGQALLEVHQTGQKQFSRNVHGLVRGIGIVNLVHTRGKKDDFSRSATFNKLCGPPNNSNPASPSNSRKCPFWCNYSRWSPQTAILSGSSPTTLPARLLTWLNKKRHPLARSAIIET